MIELSAAAAFVKIAVDLLKLAVPLCRTSIVVLAAVIVGQAVALLLALRDGGYIGLAEGAGIVLDGLMATAIAVGVTELHKAARGDVPKITT